MFLVFDDCSDKLKENDNELQDVDMDLPGDELLLNFFRPYNVEPVLQFVAKSASSDSARVSKTRIFGVMRYNVADVDGPRICGVGQNFVNDLLEFVVYCGWEWDCCLCSPK